MAIVYELPAATSVPIEIPHDQAFEVALATIRVGFNLSDVITRQGLIAKDAAGSGHHLAIYAESGLLNIRVQNPTVDAIFTAPINDQQSYKVHLTIGPGGAELFVNGIFVAQNASAPFELFGNREWLQIGGLGWGSQSGQSGFDNPIAGGTITYVEIHDEIFAPLPEDSETGEPPPPPPPPPGEIIVSTPAELEAATNAAVGGELIKLTGGQYPGNQFSTGLWAIVDRVWSDRVTFQALDPLNPPTLPFTRQERSSGFRITGLRFRGVSPGTTSPGAVELRSCDDYRFDNNDVEGGETCLKLGGGNSVRIDHNVLSGCSQAEIKFWGLDGFEIDHNDGLGIMFPDAETHGDRIQGVGNSSNGHIHSNTLRFNHRPRENGQSPSVWEAIYRGIAFDNGVYTNIEVENNIVAHTGSGGIEHDASGSGVNLVAHHNLVFNVPSRNNPHLTGDYGADALNENSNISIPGYANVGQTGADLVMQLTDPSAPLFFNDVYQNLMRGMGYEIDDFRPKPGGPADFGTDMGPQRLLAELFNEEPITMSFTYAVTQAPDAAVAAIALDPTTGDFTITPAADSIGNTSFIYEKTSALFGNSATGTWQINVVPPAVTAPDGVASVEANTPYSGNVNNP